MPGDEADALLGLAAKDKPKGKPFGLDDDEDEEDGEDDEGDDDEEDETRPPPRRPARSGPVSPPGSSGGASGWQPRAVEPGGGAGPSGEGEGGAMAASAPRRRLVRAGHGYETVALSEDQEWAEAEADRLIALAASRNAPSAFDLARHLGNVEEHYDFEVYDVGARGRRRPHRPTTAALRPSSPGFSGIITSTSARPRPTARTPPSAPSRWPRARRPRPVSWPVAAGRTRSRGDPVPIVNDTSDGHMSNANMTAAQAFESRCTDPIESGKEVVRMAGQNDGGFEKRVTPAETGSH